MEVENMEIEWAQDDQMNHRRYSKDMNDYINGGIISMSRQKIRYQTISDILGQEGIHYDHNTISKFYKRYEITKCYES